MLLLLIEQHDTRSWRNRQTRTVEGRVREGMGSSPFDRTNRKRDRFIPISFLFYKWGVAFISSIDDEGFPNTKAMLPPRKREGNNILPERGHRS